MRQYSCACTKQYTKCVFQTCTKACRKKYTMSVCVDTTLVLYLTGTSPCAAVPSAFHCSAANPFSYDADNSGCTSMSAAWPPPRPTLRELLSWCPSRELTRERMLSSSFFSDVIFVCLRALALHVFGCIRSSWQPSLFRRDPSIWDSLFSMVAGTECVRFCEVLRAQSRLEAWRVLLDSSNMGGRHCWNNPGKLGNLRHLRGHSHAQFITMK